jgi:hypothetical protein
LLALAHYRSGRQGDALAVLRRIRRHLADELGLDPGPALRALEADVLTHVPALDAPEAPAAAVAVTPEAGSERPRERASSGSPARQARASRGRRGPVDRRRLTRRLGKCPEAESAPPGWAWHEVGEGLGFTAGSGITSPFLASRRVRLSAR